jgi:hypothetical protein
MKRRREIGPKIQRNRGILIRYILGALATAVVGTASIIVLQRVIGPSQAEPGKTSHLQIVPDIILAATILIVLGLGFFGVRGYMMGIRKREGVQRGRMKIKK